MGISFHSLKSLLCLGFFVIFTFMSLPVAKSLDDHIYWMKISANDKFERSWVASLGVAIEAHGEDYVIAYGSVLDKEAFEKSGKLQAAFPLVRPEDFPKADSEYHNYQELTDELLRLYNENPDIVDLKSIGQSHELRNLWVLRISTDLAGAHKKPGVIFMGGHHAREHLSIETCFRSARWIIEQYRAGNAEVVRLVEGRDIHFIPMVNPDGAEFDIESGRYKMWRKNRALNADGTFGVDLNRNYGYQWGTGGSSNSTTSEVYMGPHAFSEPETISIKNYIESNVNITTLLSFHTFSELILYPWGHKYDSISTEKDKRVHETMAQTMATWNQYKPQQASDLYIASGDTTDWAYGVHNIISFTFELDPKNQFGGGRGFYPGAGVIDTVLKKNLKPVLYLIEYADNPYRVLDQNMYRN